MEPFRIWYDAENRFVRMVWKGYASSAQFRKGTELMFDTLIKNRACKVFGDIKDMVLIGQDDQQWLLRDFLPKAIENGCRAVALVQPEHYFNKVAVETVNDRMKNSSLLIKVFHKAEEAESWLRETEGVPGAI